MDDIKNNPASQLSVIIPYRELENLLDSGKRIEEMERLYRHMDDRYVAIMEIYREILSMVTEIKRSL